MPLFWLSLAFVGGIALGELLGASVAAWLITAAVFLGLALLRRYYRPFFPGLLDSTGRRTGSLSVPVLLLALALGGARLASARPGLDPGQVAWYNDSPEWLVIEGWVAGWPEARDQYTLLEVAVDQLRPAEELFFTPVSGRLLARVPPGGGWRYGDRVRLEGRLHTPYQDETFSYRAYLARQGIYSTLSCSVWTAGVETGGLTLACARRLRRGGGNPFMAAVYALRERSLQVVYQLFPDPEASLLAGILLGVETGIDEDVRQAFVDTGTAHIIAISGANFAIVAGLFALLFNRLLGRWRGMLVAFLGIGLYALLAGASAGVVRAAIMGGLAVFAVQIGRRGNGLNSLAFVAALMALFNPYVLWDVSFQLSFTATLGLVLYAAPLSQAFERMITPWFSSGTVRGLSKPAGEFLLYTLAAQLTTLPLVLYYFQRLSLVSLLANPLVLPAQPPVMVLGGLAVLPALTWLPLGRPGALLAWPFLAYTIRVVERLAYSWAAALSFGQISLWAVLAFYIALFALTAWGGALKTRLSAGVVGASLQGRRGKMAWATLLLLAFLALYTWQRGLSAPDGRLHLTLLDVGSGDAMLIQTPSGRFVLVDGGPSPNALSDALGRRLPFGARRLDWLVVAAAEDMQLAALPDVVERFPPGQVLWSGSTAGSLSARQLRQALSRMQAPVTFAEAGQALDLGDGARLYVLATGSQGAVLLLEWGNFRALLPVGLDHASLHELMTAPVQVWTSASVLLLAERGYARFNPPEWIAHWQPQMILLSVGAGDYDGRPDPETLQAVQDYLGDEEQRLLRTDWHGWIELTTDGEQLWVEMERK